MKLTMMRCTSMPDKITTGSVPATFLYDFFLSFYFIIIDYICFVVGLCVLID